MRSSTRHSSYPVASFHRSRIPWSRRCVGRARSQRSAGSQTCPSASTTYVESAVAFIVPGSAGDSTPSTACQLSDLRASVLPVGRAPATERAYRADWAAFQVWCAERSERPLPAPGPVVASYLDEVSRVRSVATVRRRLAAVRAAHLDAG